MKLKIKKMRENAILPTRGSKKAAGVDLYACIEEGSCALIYPGQTVMIPTGIACEFPEGYFGAMVVRSSVGAKRNLALINQIGILDEDYRGEILMAFHNYGKIPQIIEPGERVAQMILLPYVDINIVETQELSDTERGDGGFGSTGK